MIPLKDAYITSIYGYVNAEGKSHKGLDMISGVNDRNVRAIKSGEVSFIGYDANGFGNYISILQEDGYKALYCHLKSYQVVNGQKIKEGQIIGVEGDTGNTTGVHLHLEIRKKPYKTDDHIDPTIVLGIKNEKGPVKFVDNIEEEENELIKKLIDEFGENIVYEALRNICKKKKYENFVPGWAKEEFESAIANGITDGSRPQGIASRVETAVMVERAIANNMASDIRSDSL